MYHHRIICLVASFPGYPQEKWPRNETTGCWPLLLSGDCLARIQKILSLNPSFLFYSTHFLSWCIHSQSWWTFCVLPQP